MEPAHDHRREAARRELDDILREADEFRRAVRREDDRVVGDPQTTRRAPRLGLVTGGAAPDDELSTRVRIIYEGEALRLVRPGVAPQNPVLLVALRVAAAMALASVAVFLWVAFPSGPPFLEAPPLRAAYLEASARYALWVTARRVDGYASEHHALPSSLVELETSPGTPAPDLIAYERVSADGYRLTAPGPEAPIRLDDGEARRPPSRATRDALRGKLEP